jgi:hypothetical protein
VTQISALFLLAAYDSGRDRVAKEFAASGRRRDYRRDCVALFVGVFGDRIEKIPDSFGNFAQQIP